jgi:hypothetical protein
MNTYFGTVQGHLLLHKSCQCERGTGRLPRHVLLDATAAHARRSYGVPNSPLVPPQALRAVLQSARRDRRPRRVVCQRGTTSRQKRETMTVQCECAQHGCSVSSSESESTRTVTCTDTVTMPTARLTAMYELLWCRQPARLSARCEVHVRA